MTKIEFEWDEEKAQINLDKHKVSFEESITVFHDLLVATMSDPDHSEDEQRYMHEGYTVNIHQTDGTTQVRNYALTNGTVFLHPDVLKYFPDSDAVNSALRSLIALMEAMPIRADDKEERRYVE